MKVVILAGGFGQRLAWEILNDDKASAVYKEQLVRGVDTDTPYVASGLIKIGVTTALERLLTTLSSVERLMPLADNVFVVTPESHLEEYKAAAGAALPPDNFVSNGATAPSAACSAVADLALAVRHFNLGAAPVLALSSRVLFFADYNFGRVVEKAVTLKQNLTAWMPQEEGKCIIEQTPLPSLELSNAAASACKVLGVAETAQPFAPALVPMFVLQPASVPLLTQYMEEQTDAPGTLVAFVKYLAAQPQPLYAIDLEFGVFRTHSLEHLKYAEAFLNFYQASLDFGLEGLALSRDQKVSVSFADEHVKVLDYAPKPAIQGHSTVPEELIPNVIKFVDIYCFEQNNPLAAKKDPMGRSKLPPTFYMSTYKRFTSYFETGRCYPITFDDGSNF